jgi:hypothetical protein
MQSSIHRRVFDLLNRPNIPHNTTEDIHLKRETC